MKKFSIIICLSLICANNALCSSTDIVEYDKFFNEISEVRIGIDDKEIDSIANPFITIPAPAQSNNANASLPTFRLSAIIENKVKINDTWLSKGSAINGLRVIAIKQNSVVLGSENRAIELFLREKNENSIITIN
ncbi:MAG: hypothetical protein LBS39_03580 [Campylobacteraceae bacterium]|nr:hypothetical protein [Campylobacteraceae bacterium]